MVERDLEVADFKVLLLARRAAFRLRLIDEPDPSLAESEMIEPEAREIRRLLALALIRRLFPGRILGELGLQAFEVRRSIRKADDIDGQPLDLSGTDFNLLPPRPHRLEQGGFDLGSLQRQQGHLLSRARPDLHRRKPNRQAGEELGGDVANAYRPADSRTE